MYTLKKLKIEDGKTSMLSAGYTTRGSSLSLFKAGTEERLIPETFFDIEIGWQILLTQGFTWHNTSAIKEIVSCLNDRIVFRTQTSLYELTKE